ncbi:hypothetical protein LPJ61_005866, partial [Coemansia biformis]
RRRSDGDGSVYMGPMPGEFREAKPAAEPLSPGLSPRQPAGARARNNVGEDPATSGWDVSCSMGDVASVVTREQLARVLDIVQAAAPLVRRHMERQAVRDQYRERFGDKCVAPEPNLLPQLAKWVSLSCKHIYVAAVPQPGDILDGWHDSSLAVLRLKLEKVKHLALYLKELSARWESTPAASGTTSAPSATAGFMETDFWAAMTREAAARTTSPRRARSISVPVGHSAVTMSAGLQSFNLYDNCPEHHPVVLPLVAVDRSLDPRGAGQRAAPGTPGERPDAYDIWVHTSGTDRVLTVYVAPIVFVLNKALADRLSVYQALVRSILSPGAAGTAQGPRTTTDAAACLADVGASHDVTESIERLMGNLKLEAEQKLPSNVAVCSPLIRTWIMLPGTVGRGETHGSHGGSQARARGKEEPPAPGHFCIDAVDAVITNVVNGTATSSQSPNSVPEGHMRHPHIQELLESRKSVGGSGVRVECESLHVYVQAVEGGGAIEHIASMHEPSRALGAEFEAASIPRPHIEITTVATGGDGQGPGGAWHWPPAFDAFAAVNDNIRVRMAPESELTTTLEFERQAVASSRVVVSCHMPESDISLSRAAYQRLNAVINDFLLWQSLQEEESAHG